MADYKALAERVDLSKLRWLERRFLQLADPVNLFLHLIGIIIIVYGLWINVLWWVVIGIIILLIGHAYVESKRKQPAKKGKKAALELSISTIVIIVMAVTMLILGLVLIRTIMCGALVTSLDLTQKMKSKGKKILFTASGPGFTRADPSKILPVWLWLHLVADDNTYFLLPGNGADGDSFDNQFLPFVFPLGYPLDSAPVQDGSVWSRRYERGTIVFDVSGGRLDAIRFEENPA